MFHHTVEGETSNVVDYLGCSEPLYLPLKASTTTDRASCTLTRATPLKKPCQLHFIAQGPMRYESLQRFEELRHLVKLVGQV